MLSIKYLLILTEAHKYQLRVYIYQARDVMAKDSEGVSGKYSFGWDGLNFT